MRTLVIGNKNYSSWSLRAWLYLTESGLDFEEVRIALFTDGFREAVARYSPAGRVPVLVDGRAVVWDSMAIVEHCRERYPGSVGWPEEPAARAMARSISAEMHSGFLAIRDELPQNLRARVRLRPDDLSETCRAQIVRIQEMWAAARAEHGDGGPWLFGPFSIADVVYAPVALRFVSYGIELADAGRDFAEAVCALPSVRRFVAAAEAETERLAFIDDLVPTADSPLLPG